MTFLNVTIAKSGYTEIVCKCLHPRFGYGHLIREHFCVKSVVSLEINMMLKLDLKGILYIMETSPCENDLIKPALI